jgi:hypothetical protein
MSDVVPKEGYTTLPEAVKRIAAGLADRHVFLNKNQRLLDHEQLGFSKLALPEATLPWAKRQLAVWKLYEAFQNDALVSFVRDLASGEMSRITAVDWHGARLWRDTIIGGEVRALPGELIEQYNNRLVLIETLALEAWLATAKEPTTPPAVAECRDLLVNEMRASLNAKPQPKLWYRTQANRRFGISRDVFNRIWTQAIKETGATAWAEAGRPEKKKTNQ